MVILYIENNQYLIISYDKKDCFEKPKSSQRRQLLSVDRFLFEAILIKAD